MRHLVAAISLHVPVAQLGLLLRAPNGRQAECSFHCAVIATSSDWRPYPLTVVSIIVWPFDVCIVGVPLLNTAFWLLLHNRRRMLARQEQLCGSQFHIGRKVFAFPLLGIYPQVDHC